MAEHPDPFRVFGFQPPTDGKRLIRRIVLHEKDFLDFGLGQGGSDGARHVLFGVVDRNDDGNAKWNG